MTLSHSFLFVFLATWYPCSQWEIGLSAKGPESQERYVSFQTLVVAHSVALGKSPNLSAPSFQNVKQTEKGLGEFISLVERFEQLGSISAIMTSFYLQDVGSSPHFTFDSQVDLQVNESSQQNL